ncbi:MAG TPA: serine hydrolase domain-containing protein [Caulobacter sp.]|nr:serine hydrolase domain-containing protein [Caulobacter sp.]
MCDTGRRGFLFATGAAALVAGAPQPVQAAIRAAAGDNALPRLPGEIQRRFDAAMAKAGVTGAAITVVRDGELAAFYSHGRASIPFDAPITPSTLFQIGSVGKHVTALAILQLVAAGKLGLHWPVGRAVAGLPDWIAAIPIRNLLSHTGGLPDYEAGFAWDRPFPLQSLLAALKGPAFAPGEAWSYSNSGYVLLGYAIEAASGLGYGAYVTERLFKSASVPLARPDAAGEPIIGRAEPYEVVDGVVRHATRMDNTVSAMPDGGVLFSARDWAPWVKALESHRLAPAPMLAEMFKAQTLRDGSSCGYGFGWIIDQVRGKPVHLHSGSVPGFGTFIQYHPAARLMAVATFNSLPAGALRPLLEEAVETMAPGTTTIGLAARSQSARRDARLQAFLAGATAADIVAPAVLIGERASGRDPSKRLSAKPEAVEFLERFETPGGDLSRYRITIGGAAQTRQVGWTADDRIFLYR